MHWLLSVPETFSLRQVIRRSGWPKRDVYARRTSPGARRGCGPPPSGVPVASTGVHVTPAGVPVASTSVHVASTGVPVASTGDHLYRIECLDDVTVKLDLYQAPAGLVIRTDQHLSGLQIQEASERVWRMLRLDEDYQPFLKLARDAAGLKSVQRCGARLLRGTTPFEDVLTAALASWDDRGVPHFARVGSLVDRVGVPLPHNPTLHAFPDPERVLQHTEALSEILGPEVATKVAEIAAAFADRAPRGSAAEILAHLQQAATADELGRRDHAIRFLTARFALSAPSCSLLMLNLGYYDHIPTDAAAMRRFSLAQGVTYTPGVISTPGAAPRELRQSLPASKSRLRACESRLRAYESRLRAYKLRLRAQFEPWQPWGGLAFWLWDWTAAPAFEGAIIPN